MRRSREMLIINVCFFASKVGEDMDLGNSNTIFVGFDYRILNCYNSTRVCSSVITKKITKFWAKYMFSFR